MVWTLAHSSLTNVANPVANIPLEVTLKSKHIIIFADSLGANPTWYAAGYLLPFTDESPIGRVYSKGKFTALRRHTYMKLSDLEYLSAFEFRPKPWLINVQLKIWSNDNFAYDQIDRIEEKIDEILDA